MSSKSVVVFKNRIDEGIRTWSDGVCGTLRTIDASGDKLVLIKNSDKARSINCVASENKIKCIGYIEKGTGKHQSNCVYSINGLSPVICAGLGVKMPGIYVVIRKK